MDTRYRPFVKLEMSRHDAKELLALIKDAYAQKFNKDSEMYVGMSKSTKDRMCKELRDGLKPLYYYDIQCSDCHRMFEVVSEKKLTLKQIISEMDHGDGIGVVCSNCLDDYK